MIVDPKRSEGSVIVGLFSTHLGKLILFVVAAALLFALPTAAAQGCSQCRDNLAATPPQTQAAYRHAIFLLMFAGGGIFIASALLLKKYRS